jgi:autotransporter-associated beta strand protein
VGSATATPTTITLDTPTTLGQLTLTATNAATGYTLAAGYAGTLVMSNSNNQAVIMIPSGSHSITAPVVLAGALSIQPTAGMTLNILGNISEMTVGGGSLSLDGPGTLILGGSDSYTGGTTLTAGTLIATSSNSLPAGTNLTVGGGSTFIFDPSQAAAPAAGGAARVAAAPAGEVAAVPEPGTVALLAAGLIAGAGITWRKKKRA